MKTMPAELLDRLHTAQIELLDAFKSLCEEHGLRYYLSFGSLLGAVRHEGFIPWDDDMDVLMPRKDFDKLCQIAKEHFASTRYELCTPYSDRPCFLINAKLVIKNTVFQMEPSSPGEGIFIDIFPLDHVKKQKTAKRRFMAASILTTYIHNRTHHKKSSRKIRLATFFLAPFSNKKLLSLRDRIITGKGKGDLLVCYVGSCKVARIEDYEPCAMLKFGDGVYSAPGNYERILRDLYGDYMQLPPPEARVAHSPIRISFDTSGQDAYNVNQ